MLTDRQTDTQTDRRTDITKLTVHFRNIAYALKMKRDPCTRTTFLTLLGSSLIRPDPAT
jgi:hypothetical protein